MDTSTFNPDIFGTETHIGYQFTSGVNHVVGLLSTMGKQKQPF